MKEQLTTLVIVIAAVFAPAQALILTSLTLVAMDLVTGLLAAHKRGEPITSAGFRRTITKIFVYETAILLGFLTQQYLTGPLIPVSNMVCSFVGLTEFLSISENLNEIGGGSLLKVLLDKLNSVNANKG